MFGIKAGDLFICLVTQKVQPVNLFVVMLLYSGCTWLILYDFVIIKMAKLLIGIKQQNIGEGWPKMHEFSGKHPHTQRSVASVNNMENWAVCTKITASYILVMKLTWQH